MILPLEAVPSKLHTILRKYLLRFVPFQPLYSFHVTVPWVPTLAFSPSLSNHYSSHIENYSTHCSPVSVPTLFYNLTLWTRFLYLYGHKTDYGRVALSTSLASFAFNSWASYFLLFLFLAIPSKSYSTPSYRYTSYLARSTYSSTEFSCSTSHWNHQHPNCPFR